jgi:guanylate kinase
MNKNELKKYRIDLDHYEAGCGCGCEDNDLNIADKNTHESFYFIGSQNGVEKELERLKNIACPSYGNKWSVIEEIIKPRLILLSGPSCVGKGPLLAAVDNFYRKTGIVDYDILKMLKTPRPEGLRKGEDPNDFMSEQKMLEKGSAYFMGKCRGKSQALDLQTIVNCKKDVMILETYHALVPAISASPYFEDVEISTVFLSPISKEEMHRSDLEGYLSATMMQKICLRSVFQGKDPYTDEVMMKENLGRSMDAYSEVKNSGIFNHIIVNRDGEGHPNWNMNPDSTFKSDVHPKGDAGNAVMSFVQLLLTGNTSNSIKK